MAITQFAGSDQFTMANFNAKIDQGNALRPKTGTVTLTASGWVGDSAPYTQTVSIAGGNALSYVVVQLPNAAATQMAEDGTTLIRIDNNTGVFTATALGEKPTADLTVQIAVQEVQ